MKSNLKLKNKDITKEIGGDGVGVFYDYEQEVELQNKPKQINDYRKMIKDGTVEALFNIITMPILASEYSIKPEDDSPEAELQAEFVRKNLFSENYRGGIETPFELFLDQAMMALIDGFQVWEKVYCIDDGKYKLKKLAIRDSRSLELIKDARDGYMGVKQYRADGGYVEIPAHKTFLFTPGKRYDTLYGRSIFTALWNNYDKKRKLEYLDSIALQNDAIKPKILTRANTDGLSAEDKKNVISKALHILGKLGKVNSTASIPSGYDVKVLESNGRDPHQSIERQNSEMARVFLANFMLLGSQGSSSTGSFALSATQSKMFRMSLESILGKLASHINQYLIADLIDLNFSKPYYPIFQFEKVDDEIMSATFNAFTSLVQKDRISDAMASEIEDATAIRLGFDVEKIRENRKNVKQNKDEVSDDKATDEAISSGSREFHDETIDVSLSSMDKLNKKWQELERRFLDQIRPVYEAVAEETAKVAVSTKSLTDIDDIIFPKEYRKILISIFKQGFQIGKISAADESKIAAPRNSNELGGASAEYIDWIVEKQQNDLTTYVKEYILKNNILLSDESADKLSILKELLMGWFTEKLIATSSYMIAQSINSGRNSLWQDDDLIKYSAYLDGKTSAGCIALDGKVMTWKEWKHHPEYMPPRHFNCRSTLIKIPGDTPSEKIEAPNHKKIEKIDHILNTKKDLLIKENPYVAQYSKAELVSIEAYKGNGYIKINKALLGRSEITSYLEENIKNIDSAIKKTRLDKDIVLYRGIGLQQPLKVGETISHPNYASTSLDLDTALDFAENAYWNKYIFRFRAPKDMPYLDIEKIMAENDISVLQENEYLLSRGKEFIVKSIKKWDNNISMVDVELTQATKYLEDTGDSELSNDDKEALEGAMTRLQEKRKNRTASSEVRKRLHNIWQMESEYFNESRK